MFVMATYVSNFPISPSYNGLDVMIYDKIGRIPTILNAQKLKRKFVFSSRLRVQAHANVHSKSIIHNQKISHPEFDEFGLAKKDNGGSIFHQTLAVRAYEIGADEKASLETVMNYLQESLINIGKIVGGFGGDSNSSNLAWVMTRRQVEVDRYPMWEDVVKIDAYLAISGKRAYRCDWLIRDHKTSEVLIRASSNMAQMNKSTRRMSIIPDEIRANVDPFVVNLPPIMVKDTRILPKLDETDADHVCNGLKPRWTDLDVNEHVNNTKYVGWIVESIPTSIMKNYELASMTLEYHQECQKDCVLDSLTSLSRNDNASSIHVEFHHTLRLEGGGDVIMKGWTRWRPKIYQKS